MKLWPTVVIIFIAEIFVQLPCLAISISPFKQRNVLHKEIPQLAAMTSAFNDGSTPLSKKCPNQCICEFRIGTINVNCNGNTPRVLKIPEDIPKETTSLTVINNNVSRISDQDFSEITNLEVLVLSSNFISTISTSSFDLLPKLVVLDLSHNKISFLPSSLLNKLGRLRVLKLSSNVISNISPVFLHASPSLTSLDMSDNLLTNFDDNQFVHLPQLKHLGLSSNKLESLLQRWFSALTELKSLNISHNYIKSISNLMFFNLRKLNELDLSFNKIGTLGSVSFKGLSNLVYLDLKRNKITKLPYRLFSLMKNLEVLDLSYNSFTSLRNAFYRNDRMKKLTLNFLSELKQIEQGSFESLHNLQILIVSNNKKLSTINVKALSPLTGCEELDLSFNNFHTLPQHLLDGLNKLKSITLFGNSWICDCRLFWLLNWLRFLPTAHIDSHPQTYCTLPSKFHSTPVLDALDEIPCSNATIKEITKNSQFRVGSSALLKCKADGYPKPSITWITPGKNVLRTAINTTDAVQSDMTDTENFNLTHPRVMIKYNGNLLISQVIPSDGGYYYCVASNVLSNHTKAIHFMLDHQYLAQIKIISILVGIAMSMGFLLISMVILSGFIIAKRCGWNCCCGDAFVSPKTKQIRKMLEYMEQYKEQQLEKLRENYAQQTQKIKDNCSQQMERLRDSYSSQFERLQTICDFGTQQLDKVRDNYYLQVQRVRDYSAGQMDRVRENYLCQRNRIRKFSTHHLYKLRENYKIQQQHVNKIIENLNIDSCRTVCARTESIIFEPELHMETVFQAQISNLSNPLVPDNLSQSSAYFTPEDSRSRAESPSPEHSPLNCSISDDPIVNSSNDKISSMAAGGEICIKENLNDLSKCDDIECNEVEENGSEEVMFSDVNADGKRSKLETKV